MDMECNPLNHIVVVLDACIVIFTPIGKLECEIFKICKELLERRVAILTIYNTDGLLNAYFSSKYRKCNRKVVDALHWNGDDSNERLYIKDFVKYTSQNGSFERLLYRSTVGEDGMCLYTLEKSGDDLLISSDAKNGQEKGLVLVIIDKTHAHRKFFSNYTDKCFKKRKKSPDEESEWIREGVKSGLAIEYRVPPDSDILQPEITNSLCTFGTFVATVPDLVISLRMTLKESLGHILCKCTSKELGMIASEILAYISSIFSLDMTIIHPFGREGIQPWFLSEAEVYERFGFSLKNVVDCIEIFNKSIRRWGK